MRNNQMALYLCEPQQAESRLAVACFFAESVIPSFSLFCYL